MKKCSKCKQVKSVTEFYKETKTKDGLYAYCKLCQTEKGRLHRENNRERYRELARINQKLARDRRHKLYCKYLSEHSCLDCGEKNILVLEADHVSGDKEYNIGEMFHQFSWENILKELEKCEIVCRNCHVIRTHRTQNSRKFRFISGTL